MLRVACCRRVMLPATLQGEIVKTNDMSDETFLKKAIRIKKRQLNRYIFRKTWMPWSMHGSV